MSEFAKNISRSPLLAYAAGGVIIAGGCVSLGTALALSCIVLVTVMAVTVTAFLEKGRLNMILRPVLYALVSLGCVVLMSLFIDNVIAYKSVLAAGIYAPLAAFDRLFAMCSDETGHQSVGAAAKWALHTSGAFAMLALPVGLVRGLIASGRLAGGIPSMGADAFLLPFAGFILLAFAIAAMRAVFGGSEK